MQIQIKPNYDTAMSHLKKMSNILSKSAQNFNIDNFETDPPAPYHLIIREATKYSKRIISLLDREHTQIYRLTDEQLVVGIFPEDFMYKFKVNEMGARWLRWRILMKSVKIRDKLIPYNNKNKGHA